MPPALPGEVSRTVRKLDVLAQIATIVIPDTILRWHKKLIAMK